ncbi:MAG: hypothetical protein WBW31_05375 [Candidatus Sulfotelmatobacter sp.]
MDEREIEDYIRQIEVGPMLYSARKLLLGEMKDRQDARRWRLWDYVSEPTREFVEAAISKAEVPA